MRPPFVHTLDSLPRTIPVFPLPGAIVLPKGRLPLNIFEPRYLAMVLAALGEGRIIGMVQPEHDGPGGDAGTGPLHRVGCAGRIASYSETDDGRMLIVLAGACRFQVVEEMPLDSSGFRRVSVDYEPFADDLGPMQAAGDEERLLHALDAYVTRTKLSVDQEVLKGLPFAALQITLAMILPFDPLEKQSLLEARDAETRYETLLALMNMSGFDGDGSPARTQ